MNVSIIAAVASNNAIGKDNDLLWHISADLKRFKSLTEGHHIIMGKRTYFSLPRRPLPNRTSVIITDIEGEEIDGCIMAYSIEDAIAKMDNENENFIIGGGSIYKQFMPYAKKLLGVALKEGKINELTKGLYSTTLKGVKNPHEKGSDNWKMFEVRKKQLALQRRLVHCSEPGEHHKLPC